MSETLEFQKIVGDVAAAYFGNSHVTPSEIGNVIQQIAASLSAVGAPAESAAAEPVEQESRPKLTPAQIRRSITPEALISFEDGKPYKTLRRHLAAKDLTPEQYREKWGLPRDYPMVSPSYSASRAELARSIGLGSRVTRRTEGAGEVQAPQGAALDEADQAAAPQSGREAAKSERPQRGRGRKGQPPARAAAGGRRRAKADAAT